MPNKKSAKKELRKGARKEAHNLKVKEDVKTMIKKSRKAIEAKDTAANELVAKTMKALDKAAQRGIIKKNTKDRKKSRLHLKLNKMEK